MRAGFTVNTGLLNPREDATPAAKLAAHSTLEAIPETTGTLLKAPAILETVRID
jgi:hypothetical protein